MDPQQAAAVAQTADAALAASTDDYTLQSAIAQARPDLRIALSTNPYLYEGLRQWLSSIHHIAPAGSGGGGGPVEAVGQWVPGRPSPAPAPSGYVPPVSGTVARDGGSQDGRRTVRVWVAVGAFLAIVLVVACVAIGVHRHGEADPQSDAAAPQLTAPEGLEDQSDQDEEAQEYSEYSQPSPTPTQPVVTTDEEALAALRAQADRDAVIVRSRVDGSWVPQLSSKRPGMVLDGQTWDAQMVWEHYLTLHERYPSALLLFSDDWSVFDSGGGWWVVVVDEPVSSPQAANGWCDAQGIGKQDCFAKLIEQGAPSKGTTVMRP